jgi:hypothetical protein
VGESRKWNLLKDEQLILLAPLLLQIRLFLLYSGSSGGDTDDDDGEFWNKARPGPSSGLLSILQVLEARLLVDSGDSPESLSIRIVVGGLGDGEFGEEDELGAVVVAVELLLSTLLGAVRINVACEDGLRMSLSVTGEGGMESSPRSLLLL